MIGLPIVFIIGLFAYKITVSIIHHRERMARMEHGIDPDSDGGKA